MNPRLADILLVLVLLILLVVTIGAFLMIKPALPSWAAGAVEGLLLAMFIGWLTYADALRRRNRLREEPVTIADERQAVLYLRSFIDDKTPLGLTGQRAPSIEETIVPALSAIGPVIALGEPNERLPPLGANRRYAGDSWRDEIQRLIATVTAVVIRAGMTPSLLWELETVIRAVDPRRVLLVLPDDDAYRAFVSATRDVFPRALPAARGDAMFLAFDDDWNARPLSAPRWKRMLMSERANLEALRPFLVTCLRRGADDERTVTCEARAHSGSADCGETA